VNVRIAELLCRVPSTAGRLVLFTLQPTLFRELSAQLTLQHATSSPVLWSRASAMKLRKMTAP
jgi:hypothetical protein